MSNKRRSLKKLKGNSNDKTKQLSIQSALFNMSAKKEKKPEPFKFATPMISPYVIEIDSDDSDFETAPNFERRALPISMSSDEELDEIINTKTKPKKLESLDVASDKQALISTLNHQSPNLTAISVIVSNPAPFVASTPIRNHEESIMLNSEISSVSNASSPRNIEETTLHLSDLPSTSSGEKDSNDSDATIIYNSPVAATATNIPVNVVRRELFPENTKRPTPENVFAIFKKKKTSVSQEEKENTPSPPNSQSSNSSMNLRPLALFNEILNNVLESHYKELVVEESEIVKSFLDLKRDYQYLCFKLFTRKDKWNNIFELVESLKMNMNPGDVTQMYYHLVEMDFLSTDTSKEDIITLLKNLSLKQVKDIYTCFKLKYAKTKEQMIDKLIQNCRKQSTLYFSKTTEELLKDKIKKQMKYYVKLNTRLIQSLSRYYLLETFVNPDFEKINDFFHSMFVLQVDFPRFQYEPCKVFESRTEFLKFAQARQCRLEMIEAEENKDHFRLYETAKTAYAQLQIIHDFKELAQRKENPYVQHFSAGNIYSGILTNCCKKLTTKYPEEVKIWLEYLISTMGNGSKLGGWFLQLSWVYSQYIQPPNKQKAAELMIEILGEKREHITEVQFHDIGQKAKNLLNLKNHNLQPETHKKLSELLPEKFERFPFITISALCQKSNESGKKRNYYIQEDDGSKNVMSVEEIARYHYRWNAGFENGMHCEGSLMHGMFLLLFWDLIYETNVPGTFISKYQLVPLDFFTDNFYLNRAEHVDQRLTDIEHNWSEETVITKLQLAWNQYGSNYSICNIIGNIPYVDLLETLVICIGKTILSKVFRRLVTNYKKYRSGFPDLLLWNRSWRTSKFVEVKGEGDVLQTNQKLWIQYLLSIGADVEVCHVHPPGSRKKRNVNNEK